MIRVTPPVLLALLVAGCGPSKGSAPAAGAVPAAAQGGTAPPAPATATTTSNSEGIMVASEDTVAADTDAARSSISFGPMQSPRQIPPIRLVVAQQHDGSAYTSLRYSARSSDHGLSVEVQYDDTADEAAGEVTHAVELRVGEEKVVMVSLTEVQTGHTYDVSAGAVRIIGGTERKTIELNGLTFRKVGLGGAESAGPWSGTIEGEIERECIALEANDDPHAPRMEGGQPARRPVLDVAWSSDFCAAHK